MDKLCAEFLQKLARDENVRLTNKKGTSLPYRRRAEVFAIDENGEVIARTPRGMSGKYFEVPGGGIDEGETPRKAVMREALEETGIRIGNIVSHGELMWKWDKTHKEAMGPWSKKYAGDHVYVFSATVIGKGKPTSEEGDSWKKVPSMTLEACKQFLLTKQRGALKIMNGKRLSVINKLIRERDEGLQKQAKIELDIEIGDVVLTGRYKNKRTVVKSLGTDELGQNTINGMKLLAIRIEKKMPKDKQSSVTRNMRKEASLEGYTSK